jgi:hypothetical protein
MTNIRAYYTIRQLCDMSGLSRAKVEWLIRRNGIICEGGGKPGCNRLVPLSEIAEKLPHWLSSCRWYDTLDSARHDRETH